MKKLNLLIISLILTTSSPLFAQTNHNPLTTDERYTFTTTAQQTEFNHLLKNLRCLVCQNQDLSDSHAQFSEDLREQIHQWISEGKSQQEIVEILTTEYGDFILFEPPVKNTTYLLWYAPFAIFLFAIAVLLAIIYLRKKKC